MPDFTLHPQLAEDTIVLGDLSLSRVLLMNDKRFPWLILVPRRENMRDLVDLLPADQTVLLHEINLASRTLQAAFSPDKLNVAALGNMVPQLHIHVIARFENDAAWPKPVWGIGEAEKYSAGEILQAKTKLAALSTLPRP